MQGSIPPCPPACPCPLHCTLSPPHTSHPARSSLGCPRAAPSCQGPCFFSPASFFPPQMVFVSSPRICVPHIKSILQNCQHRQVTPQSPWSKAWVALATKDHHQHSDVLPLGSMGQEELPLPLPWSSPICLPLCSPPSPQGLQTSLLQRPASNPPISLSLPRAPLLHLSTTQHSPGSRPPELQPKLLQTWLQPPSTLQHDLGSMGTLGDCKNSGTILSPQNTSASPRCWTLQLHMEHTGSL